MKKLLVFLTVLFVSVMCSACINNLAIQELNTKAKEYLDKGDYDEAVKRLESSVDLDGSVFETRYNLAVAYVNKEEFSRAVKQLNEAISLNSQSPDAYYTLGVALEGEASEKLASEKVSKAAENSVDEGDTKQETVEKQGSGLFENAEDAQYAADKLNEAIQAYKKYLEIAGSPDDKDTVNAHIKELEADRESYLKEVMSLNAGDDSKTPALTDKEAG